MVDAGDSGRRSPFGSRLLGPREQDPRRLRLRIRLLLTALLLFTNLAGAAVTMVINLWAVPAPPPSHRLEVAMAVGIPVYVLVGAIVGVLWGTAASLRALRWATEPGAVPDDDERRQALRVPLHLTAIQFVIWFGGCVLSTAILTRLQPSRALMTGLTILIGSIVVSGIAYLLCEFALRPVSARAMSGIQVTHPVRGVGVGPRMVLFWIVGTAAPVLGLLAIASIALHSSRATLDQLAIVTIATCAVVLLTGFVLTDLNARSVRAPILAVRDAMLGVGHGRFEEVAVYDGTELGALQSGYNEMVRGLREREKIRDLFSRHVGTEVAEAATAAETGEVSLFGETMIATVLFVDLVGSTAYAATRPPAEVVAMLNRFFGVVVDEVDREHGLVNKFIGDAVLAVFGAPAHRPDHAAAALSAARMIAARLAIEVPEVGAGIGVATGTVVAGNVGHEQRYEYTVIGDAVNSASRLTDLAKELPGRLVASWDSVLAARDAGASEAGLWIEAGATTLRGRTTPTQLALPNPASLEG
ncbi:MAG TPA: adenylate/guanylate cyclase domain-containing protein [Nocardioides sp.]|nr:adenylate/guanylate cyclase domain-containing protein [Nocardioides sp.]